MYWMIAGWVAKKVVEGENSYIYQEIEEMIKVASEPLSVVLF